MAFATLRPKTLSAWKGSSLLIVNARRERREDDPLTGYYFRETRFLRSLRLINDEAPWLCAVASGETTETSARVGSAWSDTLTVPAPYFAIDLKLWL